MIIDKEKFVKTIENKDKIIEIRRFLDKIEMVLNKHTIECTDFMDPYSIRISETVLKEFDDLAYRVVGSVENEERQVIYLYQSYYEPDELDDLDYLRITGNLENLTHRDYLGAILNLGIKREKVGDILEHLDYTDIIVKKEIGDFLLFNLEKIKRQNIKIEKINRSELLPSHFEYEDIRSFLPSLRLDAYISAAYKISRNESVALIKADKVKVNWQVILKSSYEISEGDMVSVRGYGRSYLNSIDGTSKKGRINSVIRIIL